MKKNVIYIVGIGPGDVKKMTVEAYETIYAADVIIGYGTYVELVKKSFPEKSFLVTPMTKEVERCRMAYEEALRDPEKTVAVISSGDAGVYGMASIMYELSSEYPFENGIEESIQALISLINPSVPNSLYTKLSTSIISFFDFNVLLSNSCLMLLQNASDLKGIATENVKSLP